MQTLFVTSFTLPMYQATGRELVRSFASVDMVARLLVCYENMPEQPEWQDSRLIALDLGRSPILNQWLRDSAEIIPDYLGGAASTCNCRAPSGQHENRCSFGWFNRNASRWFRKIVAIHSGSLLHNFDAIIWLDSDCVIHSAIPPEEIAHWFGDSAAFYLKSNDRPVIESGIIGFRTNEDGLEIISSVLKRYLSQEFRSDLRWDDGYQFQLAFSRHRETAVRDLATHASGGGPFGHVVCNSPVGRYIRHLKGIHASSGLMT